MARSTRVIGVAGLLFVLAGCSALGTALPSVTPVVSPAPATGVPSPASAPASAATGLPAIPSAGIGAISSTAGAIAAVVAGHPQFAGYQMLPPLLDTSPGPGSSRFGPVGAADRSVIAEGLKDGYRIIFVTGSGDCPSGCTEHRYDVFLVHADGTVEGACVVDSLPTPPGLKDPCAAG